MSSGWDKRADGQDGVCSGGKRGGVCSRTFLAGVVTDDQDKGQ